MPALTLTPPRRKRKSKKQPKHRYAIFNLPSMVSCLMHIKAAITPAVVPTVELSSPDNGELSEEDPEITALEVKLRAMREAHCTKDTSGRSTVSQVTQITTPVPELTKRKGAEIVFHDDIFTPDINSYGLADVEMSDNIVLHDATATTKISPAVKQKAATEAVKKEKYAS